jgi:hypothetical protein
MQLVDRELFAAGVGSRLEDLERLVGAFVLRIIRRLNISEAVVDHCGLFSLPKTPFSTSRSRGSTLNSL